MFAKFVAFSIAASLTLALSPAARCQNDFRNSDEQSRSAHPDATRIAEGMAAEIVSWLSSNFDLPAIKILLHVSNSPHEKNWREFVPRIVHNGRASRRMRETNARSFRSTIIIQRPSSFLTIGPASRP